MTPPTTYRMRDGRPEHRPPGARSYRPMRQRDILALPVDSEAWTWLRSQGVRRPSPSGATTPPERRTNQAVLLTLAPPVREHLDTMQAADGATRSGLVSALVESEWERRQGAIASASTT